MYPLVESIFCRSPWVRTITFISQPPHLLYGVRVALDFFLSCRVVPPSQPYMRFLFVGPKLCPCWHFSAFTFGFLHIPSHDGHPCLRLAVPATESAMEFHHLVIAHAGHAAKERRYVNQRPFIAQKSRCGSKAFWPSDLPAGPETLCQQSVSHSSPSDAGLIP